MQRGPRGSVSYAASDGRRFAFTLAAAFAVIATLAWWRDAERLFYVLGAIGFLLAVAGAVVPARLGPVERVWMRLAHALSRVTAPIFLGIIYFAVLTPAGMLRRTFGRNPLEHPLGDGTYWVKRDGLEPARRRSRMERQF